MTTRNQINGYALLIQLKEKLRTLKTAQEYVIVSSKNREKNSLLYMHRKANLSNYVSKNKKVEEKITQKDNDVINIKISSF